MSTANNFKLRAFNGSAVILSQQVFSKAVTFIANVVLARLLIPEQFGIYAIVAAAVQIFNILGDVGLGASLVQQENDPSASEEATVFTAQQIILLVPMIAILLGAPEIARAYKLSPDSIWLIRLVAASGIITTFGTISRIRMERRLQFKKLAVIDTAQALVFQSVAIASAFFGAGSWSFALAALCSQLTGAVIANVCEPFSVRWEIHLESLKSRLRFGASFLGMNVLGFARDCVTPFFIGSVCGAASVGIVGFAFTVSTYPTLFFSSLGKVYFAAFSRCQKDQVKLRDLAETVLWWNNALILIVTCAFFPTIDFFVPLVFGPKWIAAIPLIKLLSLLNGVIATCHPLGCVAVALGKPDLSLRYLAVLAAANWVVTVLMVSQFGLIGCGLAQILLIAVHLYFIRQVRGLANIDVFKTAGPLWAAFVISTALTMTAQVLFHVTGPPLLLLGFAGVAVFAGVALRTGSLEERIREGFKMLSERNGPASSDTEAIMTGSNGQSGTEYDLSPAADFSPEQANSSFLNPDSLPTVEVAPQLVPVESVAVAVR